MLLKNIIKCNESDWQKVLDLRNSEGIRNNMYTDHVISWDEHKSWISKLKEDNKNIAFTVYNKNDLIGLVSINNINHKHKTSDWAFYLSPSVQGQGLGAVLEFTILDYVFQTMNLEKLNCQVLNFNEPVIKMHEKFGFLKEAEIRSQIHKSQGRVNVVHLGMTKSEWIENRINKKYVLDRYGQSVDIVN